MDESILYSQLSSEIVIEKVALDSYLGYDRLVGEIRGCSQSVLAHMEVF